MNDKTCINLTPFKPENRDKLPTILVLGESRIMTSVVLAQSYKLHKWASWSSTKEKQDFWAARFGSHATVHGNDESGRASLLRILAYQEKIVRHHKCILKKPLPEKYTLGLIFDDVHFDELFENGKLAHTLILVVCDTVPRFASPLKTNTDYVVLSKPVPGSTNNSFERLFSMWDEDILTETENCSNLLRCTNDKTCLVYDNYCYSDRLDKMFQTYCFDYPVHLEIGDKEWQEYMAFVA